MSKSNAVGGGKFFRIPGISDPEETPADSGRKIPSVFRSWTRPFVIYLSCVIFINISAGAVYAFLYPSFTHNKSADALSGPAGSGYVIASSTESDASIVLLLMWVGTLVLDFLVFLIFIIKSRLSFIQQTTRVMGIIFIPTAISAMLVLFSILGMPDGSSMNTKSFSDWVKEKYSLSYISSFSPSDNYVEGKDANGNTVKINLVNVGNTYYPYQTKEELLRIAKEINQDVK